MMTAAARFSPRHKAHKSSRIVPPSPMDAVNRIKKELEKSGVESCVIGKRAETQLLRVYFPSVI